MNKVLISGYIGFRNAGDEAILAAITRDLKVFCPEVEITVLSRDPARTQRIHGVRAVNRFDPWSVFREIAATDLLISGGGSLLQDVTSSRSLYYYLSIIFLAQRLGKKVALYANGFGPITRSYNRALVTRVLDTVDLITLRDETSGEEVSKLALRRARVVVTADPTFSLEPAEPGRIDAILAAEGVPTDRPLAGVAVRRWKSWDHYRSVIAETADTLARKHGTGILFIPMETPGDVGVAEEIAGDMKSPASILRGEYLAAEYLGIIGRLSLLLGMRLHSLIFAARQGVPMVGLTYDPKVENFLRSLGQPSAGDVRRLRTAELIAFTEGVLARREALRQDLLAKASTLRDKARESARLIAELLRSEGEAGRAGFPPR